MLMVMYDHKSRIPTGGGGVYGRAHRDVTVVAGCQQNRKTHTNSDLPSMQLHAESANCNKHFWQIMQDKIDYKSF